MIKAKIAKTILFLMVNHGAAFMDAYTTRHNVSRGALELNPVVRTYVHSPAATYSMMQAEAFFVDYLRFKKPASRPAQALVYSDIGSHALGATVNAAHWSGWERSSCKNSVSNVKLIGVAAIAVGRQCVN